MLFLWGAKRVSKPIRNIGYSGCDQCRAQQPCSARLDYTVRHLWYVVRWVTGKEYTGFCDVCGSRIGLLDPKAVEAKRKKNPVPFLDRWSWSFAVAALAGLIGFAIYDDAEASKRDAVYLASPRVGDLYLIVDDKLSIPGCSDCRYGSALVSSVQADGVYVRQSRAVSNRVSHTKEDRYFMDRPEFVSMSKLRDMKARGQISHVER